MSRVHSWNPHRIIEFNQIWARVWHKLGAPRLAPCQVGQMSQKPRGSTVCRIRKYVPVTPLSIRTIWPYSSQWTSRKSLPIFQGPAVVVFAALIYLLKLDVPGCPVVCSLALVQRTMKGLKLYRSKRAKLVRTIENQPSRVIRLE